MWITSWEVTYLQQQSPSFLHKPRLTENRILRQEKWDSDCKCTEAPHTVHEKYQIETYAQLLVPAVTFIIVIATISVLLIFLLQNRKRDQIKMQHLFHLQPFWLLVEPYKQQLMRHGHCCWKWFLGEALFLQVTDQITILCQRSKTACTFGRASVELLNDLPAYCTRTPIPCNMQQDTFYIWYRSVPLLLEPAVNAGAVSSLYQTEHWWQRLNSWLSLWIGSSMLNHLQMLALLWIRGNVICTVLPYQLFITSIFLEELSCGPGFGSTFILFFFPLPCFSSFSL